MTKREIEESKKAIKKATKKASSSKEAARAYLHKAGILTKAGNLAPAYK